MKTLALMTGILLLNASWYGQKPVKSIPTVSKNGEIIHSNTTIVRGTIIKKDFPDKGLRNLGWTELHFQIAGKDYLIKFCDSNVSRDELERHVDFPAASDPVGDPEITLEVEIHNGALDMCHTQRLQSISEGLFTRVDFLEPRQTRYGRYVIIHSIIESQTGD